MAFTGTPGDANASPQNFVPAYGLNQFKYSKSLSASLTPTGSLNSLSSSVFNYLSVTAFRAVSRATKFLTIMRPNI
jgi:hypothetical protein